MPAAEAIPDVSLITGEMRATHLCDPLAPQPPSSTTLACRDQTRALAEMSPAGLLFGFVVGLSASIGAMPPSYSPETTPTFSPLPATFLESRSWRGLEQQLGKTAVSKAVQGRRGIAIAYEDEGREQS